MSAGVDSAAGPDGGSPQVAARAQAGAAAAGAVAAAAGSGCSEWREEGVCKPPVSSSRSSLPPGFLGGSAPEQVVGAPIRSLEALQDRVGDGAELAAPVGGEPDALAPRARVGGAARGSASQGHARQ